jgi:flagellar motility protein MotE (MotC chaperone)
MPADAGEAADASARDCANIAASAEALRIERRRKHLEELESGIVSRLSALDAKQQELRGLLDRLEAFERRTSDALVGLYSRMKPEAAAAQLAQIDDEVAAALMLQLKAKISSAILGEMDASRGAALAKKIADLRNVMDGKKP